MSNGRLQGLEVLVTRPGHQCGPLCAMLEAEGAVPVQFPVLSIEPLADSDKLEPGFAGLSEQDLVIFTSPNAVSCCLELMRQRGLSWPSDGPEVAAIGRATADALDQWGIPVAVCPEGPYTSEGLLAHPRMHQTADQRTLLIRGIGGREVLAETLRERGARVSTLEVYRRTRPDADPAPLLERWQRGGLHVVVVTSLEGLDNLLALVGPEGRDALLGSGLVTVSGRVATAARVRGFLDGIVVAPEASDSGLVEGLVNWRKKHGNGGAAMKDDDNNNTQAAEASGDNPPALPSRSGDGGDGRGGNGNDTASENGAPRAATGLAGLALVLLLILAAITAGGGWWLYERLRVLESSQDGLATDLELAELRDSAVSRAERLAGRVDNLAAEHQSHTRDLARAEEAMQQVRESQSRVGERMERLEELAAARREDWIRSEVDYLYGMARHRLMLRGDVSGALAALKEADGLLERLGGQAVPQREALREHINTLLDVRTVDVAGNASRLSGMAAQVDQWAVHEDIARLEPEPLGRQPDADLTTWEGWRNASARAWHQLTTSLSSLVVVRREGPPPVLMAPDEEWFLRENLRLQLQTARLALVQEKPDMYRESLVQARDWLERYFRQDDPQVERARETLAELAGQDIRPELPSLPERLGGREEGS